jgi:hypothetical protein
VREDKQNGAPPKKGKEGNANQKNKKKFLLSRKK